MAVNVSVYSVAVSCTISHHHIKLRTTLLTSFTHPRVFHLGLHLHSLLSSEQA